VPSFAGVVEPEYSISTKSSSVVQKASEFSTDHFHSSSYDP